MEDDPIFGLKVGEVHPPDPRTSAFGVMECDSCPNVWPCHFEAFYGYSSHCKCGGRYSWRES